MLWLCTAMEFCRIQLKIPHIVITCNHPIQSICKHLRDFKFQARNTTTGCQTLPLRHLMILRKARWRQPRRNHDPVLQLRDVLWRESPPKRVIEMQQQGHAKSHDPSPGYLQNYIDKSLRGPQNRAKQ